MKKDVKGKKVVEKVFKEIKEDDIKIKPRCHILACKLFWALIAFFIFIFSIYLAVISLNYLILFKPFSVLANNVFFVPAFYPFIIFILSVVFIYIASRFYRKSRTCCRHEEWMLLGAMLFLALVVLTFAAFSGLDRKIFYATEKSPAGKKFFVTNYNYWSLPEEGTLSGVVFREVEPFRVYQVKDWKGGIWKVGVQDCLKSGKELFRTQGKIKMIGEKKENRGFEAAKVWAWNY